jgi:hypothetical protein
MLRPLLFVAALAAASPAFADPDLDALRAEVEQMKASYEARIQALEARLQAAEAKAGDAAHKADDAAQRADAAAAQGGATQAATNTFNPDTSIILQGTYSHLDKRPQRITGYLPNGSAAAPRRGFSLGDSELVFAANIDPDFRGYLNAVLAEDGTVGIEEAWFQTLSLGHGLTLKGGRFRSGIGYQNEQHPHVWDFATNNLMYEALFGEGYGNDGLQLKWVAPTALYTELGAEIGRGANFPGTDRNINGIGSYALYGHVGGDVGDSSSWRGGVSYLSTRADARASTLADFSGTPVDTAFSGDSRTWMADFVWKWAPNGNPTVNNFKFAAELFRREEAGSLDCLGTALCGTGAYNATQSGGYAQAVYQFMPRWRVGYRYDRLSPGSVDFGLNNAHLPRPDYAPTRHSLMTDYSPSEFSRVRLQYTRDRALQGQDANAWYLQYIYSLGTHGAHQF